MSHELLMSESADAPLGFLETSETSVRLSETDLEEHIRENSPGQSRCDFNLYRCGDSER
jgi:hypothetical protein